MRFPRTPQSCSAQANSSAEPIAVCKLIRKIFSDTVLTHNFCSVSGFSRGRRSATRRPSQRRSAIPQPATSRGQSCHRHPHFRQCATYDACPSHQESAATAYRSAPKQEAERQQRSRKPTQFEGACSAYDKRTSRAFGVSFGVSESREALWVGSSVAGFTFRANQPHAGHQVSPSGVSMETPMNEVERLPP